ncbi:MAG: hypothetical protein V4525_05595 [Pseudomonadota bacterium]
MFYLIVISFIAIAAGLCLVFYKYAKLRKPLLMIIYIVEQLLVQRMTVMGINRIIERGYAEHLGLLLSWGLISLLFTGVLVFSEWELLKSKNLKLIIILKHAAIFIVAFIAMNIILNLGYIIR